MSRAGETSVAIEIEAPQNSIPPEELERLLSPDPWAAGRRRYGALALGLGLARSLVELHRGTPKVKRTDRGTPLFEVSLPVAPEERRKDMLTARLEEKEGLLLFFWSSCESVGAQKLTPSTSGSRRKLLSP